MGAVFEIYIAKSHAIHHLDTHPDLDLITKLELCHRFRIISWLPPTFKALVNRPIESFDPLGLEQIIIVERCLFSMSRTAAVCLWRKFSLTRSFWN
ncbi:hypothetical protein BDR07DRAFT_1397595, partial [Suillus spraguei]